MPRRKHDCQRTMRSLEVEPNGPDMSPFPDLESWRVETLAPPQPSVPSVKRAKERPACQLVLRDWLLMGCNPRGGRSPDLLLHLLGSPFSETEM